jgi:hypothetical protein
MRRVGWFLLGFLLLNGVRGSDFPQFRFLVEHPLALLPEVDGQFRHGSPLTYLAGVPLAELFGPHAAFALVTAGGFGLLALALRRFLRPFPAAQRATILVVLASTPLLVVLTRWIGKSDPYLAAFYLLVVTARRPALQALLAAAMVLCHREIATVILVLHIACARRDVAPLLAGLAAGHGLVLAYWHLLLPAPPASRAQYAAGHREAILAAVVTAPLVHIAFALNWFWYFLFAHARRARDLAPIAVVLLVAAMATDFTRVASLCALPIILHVAVRTPAAALPRARWFPLLFVVQFQVEGFLGRTYDWNWLR